MRRLTPTLQLVIGRSIGLAASFAIGVVLARLFEPAAFGVYKQFFLVSATLYGVLQLGMAESLYYFVPRGSRHTGRYVANAIVTLAVVGAASTAALYAARPLLAGWLTPELAANALPLGLFLTCMLAATVLEIVLIAERRHASAAITYAVSDIIRTLLFVIPALLFVSLRAVFIGAAAFAALRLAAAVAMLWRAFGRELRLDLVRWREQLGYALPFAAAVGIEVVLINYHQYVVAARFDAATFAIYAIGCMQIPLYDLIVTSTVSVLMVRMADAPGRAVALDLWHDTVCRLAFLIFPLVALLIVGAHPLIVGLFTATYSASVPIFILWTLTMLPAVMAVDGVLRVYAQTRFLLVMNLVRLGCVAGLIGALLSSFGLRGAVLVTLVALTVTKGLGLVRMAFVLRIGAGRLLPWRQLARIAAITIVSAAPAFWVQRIVGAPPLAVFMVSAAVYAATYAVLSYGSTSMFGAAPAREEQPSCAA
ncbi:MAG: oligosaccharide flippase family protein [Acidobacteria bacterium]|nr:oligosaccharide flippase family protein [Acidobacteriota bacterium]